MAWMTSIEVVEDKDVMRFATGRMKTNLTVMRTFVTVGCNSCRTMEAEGSSRVRVPHSTCCSNTMQDLIKEDPAFAEN